MYDDLVKRLRECTAEQNGEKTLWHQAADAIEELSRTRKAAEENSEYWQKTAVNLECDLHIAEGKIPRWIPVTERLPENDVHVLLSCKCVGGTYVCDGFHTEKYSTPAYSGYDDIEVDYDEETDEYYLPEGWWEVIKNWDEYSSVAIEDTVTHWMPLPPPKGEQE